MARGKIVMGATPLGAAVVTATAVLLLLAMTGTAIAQRCTDADGSCDVVAKNNASSNDTEQSTTFPKTVAAPKSMDMLAEDHLDRVLPVRNVSTTEEPTGRALNFTMDNHSTGNVLQINGNKSRDLEDLSDVSIDDNDDIGEQEMQNAKILTSTSKDASSGGATSVCEKGGLTYESGEKLEIGCDSICTCTKGKMECEDRCPHPFFRKGKRIGDPLCVAKDAEDPCCSVMVCTADTETEPLEMCSYANKTYNRGDIFNKGCEEVCSCEIAGNISCKARCPPVNKTSDRCVEVQDSKDPCCKKVFCDVTLDDPDDKDNKDEVHKSKLLSAKFINSTTVELRFDSHPEEYFMFVEASEDKNRWETYKIDDGRYVTIKPGAKYLRMENSDDIIGIGSNLTASEDAHDGICLYKGSTYKLGDEYNDNCTSLCVCKQSGMKCLKMECPTYFGVDVLDPNCIEWETIPPNFVPSPPNCCPHEVKCKNNGSCNHEGHVYQNWQQLPINVTGCEKRCYCEMGKVECQNNCFPVPALPPSDLPCLPHQAKIGYLPDDDCCKYWVCDEEEAHPETRRNETTKDEKPSKINKTTTTTTTTTTSVPHLGPFTLHPTKEPSKILGPLLVYGNKDEINPTELPTRPSHPPKNSLTSPYENPFFHDERPQKSSYDSSSVKKNKPSAQLPIQTGYDKKEHKISKPKPNVKDEGLMFVTPPTKQSGVHYVPNKQKVPYLIPHSLPNKPQQQQPDDLLQFIHQHPEIVNYPSGSVLEIHNVPNSQKPNNPPFVLPSPHDRPGQHQIVPYVIPQNPHGHLDDLPPGISLEQILQEIHRTANPHAIVPFPQNGPVLITPQSGHILANRPNATYPGGQMFPGNYPSHPAFQQPQDEVSVHTLEALDAHTVRLAFMVPPVIVGLHGRVEVRYTHLDNDDFNNWELQVFAPPNDLIATPQLEFDLLGLKADTEYRIKITITLRDLHNTPSSRIYKIKTPKDVSATTLPPMIPIKPELAIADINATWVTVTWRKFTEYELEFIDGVQLRYKELEGKIYDATPLIHRSVISYTLENLKANTKYEIGIFLIPFPGQLTELHSAHMLHFTTANEVDTYGFNVTLDVGHVKSTSIEITWSGVPYPEDKYVNIYRAIYQSDSGKEDQSTFKIAKRDSPTKTVIMDLKPGTRYRLWLEVYLTNGKIKTSNVQDFITKPRAAIALGSASQQGETRETAKGDYYGPLVIVAILAAIAILSTLILLLILVRRHNQNKAAITPPSRVSQSAYDNPTYKVEIQQETMGL